MTMSNRATESRSERLARLDQQHVWHPFTPMKQWRQTPPTIIERGDGPYIFDTDGNRYLDGSSAIWCNVHGHRVPELDQAAREQLDQIAHTTLLGMGSPPSIELAAMLAERAPGALNKVFYSDNGSTALELAFKMAVGYWYHRGQTDKHKFIALNEAYHGDTVGAMSVGYSEGFHRPFLPLVFQVDSFPNPDPIRTPTQSATQPKTATESHSAASARSDAELRSDAASPRAAAHDPLGPHDYTQDRWPSEDDARAEALRAHCLQALDAMLAKQAHETAAVVIEPMMQGAAGMICQPPGFLKGVEQLCRKHNVLLIADEVAVGFGRTGKLFAVEHESVTPDILCLAKGISGGYLPLAATLASDDVDAAFTGAVSDRRTLFHGHTYTGNALACAVAVASLQRFEDRDLLSHIAASSEIIHKKLRPLLQCPHVFDVRQRGIMTGIEIGKDRQTGEKYDYAQRVAASICKAAQPKGLFIRPIEDVMMLMPIPAMDHDKLEWMLDTVVETVLEYPYP